MTTTSTLGYTVLGTSDLPSGYVVFTTLPNGQLFAVDITTSVIGTSQSTDEFLNPTATSITNVTSSASMGTLPMVGNINFINELTVPGQSLPDIVISDAGADGESDLGAQLKVLVPNANGQYVDETGLLPQQIAFNHRTETGVIDGQPAIVVADLSTSAAPASVELLIANSNGAFTNISSELPANIQSVPSGAVVTPFNEYTFAAIGNFSDGNGDIFLGSINGDTPNSSLLLINNGKGGFTEDPIAAAYHNFNDPAGTTDEYGNAPHSPIVFALPTKFYGDTNEDLVVVYANSGAASYSNAGATSNGTNTTVPGYYLQFLQGNGSGGFTDVTAQHLAVQPTILNSSGQNAWIEQIQQVTINGFNDLILYQAGGAPEILVNNGKDVYTASSAVLPSNLNGTSWGTDAGVQGFYGLNTSNQWIFVPISAETIGATATALNAPLASQLYLYGAASAGAITQAQTFETTITITLHATVAGATISNGELTSGTIPTFNLVVNGHVIGSDVLANTYGSTYQGSPLTSDQTFTFNVAGLQAISSLQLVDSEETATNNLYINDVQVNGVDLGAQNSFSGTTDTISAAAWNGALAARNIGTASAPITVTGGGGDSAAYVLGNHTQYTESGIGTSSIHLNESAGLDQNAVLSDVSYVVFQDGSVLNTQTGAWTTTTVSVTAAQASAEPSYVTTINVSDTASNVSSSIDSLETLASAGILGKVTLTDTGIPTITVSAAQFANDSGALKALSGSFNTVITLPSTSATIHGGISGLGTVADINGASTAYTISAAGDGTDFTIAGSGVTYHLSGITEVQFNDANLIIASQSATGTQAPTSAQVTELYGAVFGRLPDAGGLAYYEQTAAANSGIGFLTYAEWFLSSPEYTGNSAHAYALNSTGDAQFITNSYANLLGRAPEAGAVQWYETNVINPIIQADTAAGQTMAQAELQAHAQVLVYFSQSAEFTNDVSTTGTGTPAFGGHHWLLLV